MLKMLKHRRFSLTIVISAALIASIFVHNANAQIKLTSGNGNVVDISSPEEYKRLTNQLTSAIKNVHERMKKYAPNSSTFITNRQRKNSNKDITQCNENPLQIGPFYCGFDEKIGFDTDFTLLWNISRSATRGVMAHEMGHAATREKIGEKKFIERINANEDSLRTLELLADCIMGAYAKEYKDKQAGQQGSRASKRRDLDNPYFDDVIHGTPKQREEAYRLGLKLGKTDKCLNEKRYQ